MEHEVASHAKKIYGTVKNPKHSFGEKIKDILVEVFIIVFAVSLSIWFHNWSEHRHEQKEANEFLKGLSDDLTNDVKQFNTSKNVIEHIQSNYRNIVSPEKGRETDVDSLIAHFEVDLRVARPNIGRYEGFKSSGKIGTIENDSLKENILVFYEQTIPDLNYGENFVNNLQVKIQDLSFENSDKMSPKQFAATPKINSLFWLALNNFDVNKRGYEKAAVHAQKIIDQIKNEIE